MKDMRRHSAPLLAAALAIVPTLLLLCSCATQQQTVPGRVPINKEAGRGGVLMVTVRLETGEKLPFALDTGSPSTVFDKSLEPRLGKRVGRTKTRRWSKMAEGGIYVAPTLYLGNTPLRMTGSYVVTDDLTDLAQEGGPILGVLGMDVLEHYCFQLDFQSRKVRFLGTKALHPEKLGTAFPLTFTSEPQEHGDWGHPYIHQPPLLGGESANIIIDTGCSTDGAVPPEVFRKLQDPKQQLEPDSLKVDGSKDVLCGKCIWHGQTYTNLILINGPNLVGLRFLARHLVTFDLPNRTMYLKQTSVGPLVDKELEAALDAAAESALKVLWRMAKKGQLAGWSKSDHASPESADCDLESLNCITCNLRKEGDSAIYHYEFTRASKKSTFKLRKAWRTTENNRTVEEYPVP